jgi:hypothetical protein
MLGKVEASVARRPVLFKAKSGGAISMLVKVEASIARRPVLFKAKSGGAISMLGKVEASVARRLRAPPYAAKRKGFCFGTSTA